MWSEITIFGPPYSFSGGFFSLEQTEVHFEWSPLLGHHAFLPTALNLRALSPQWTWVTVYRSLQTGYAREGVLDQFVPTPAHRFSLPSIPPPTERPSVGEYLLLPYG